MSKAVQLPLELVEGSGARACCMKLQISVFRGILMSFVSHPPFNSQKRVLRQAGASFSLVMYHNERRLTQKLRDEAGRKKEN